jgi:hypothetical protein
MIFLTLDVVVVAEIVVLWFDSFKIWTTILVDFERKKVNISNNDNIIWSLLSFFLSLSNYTKYEHESHYNHRITFKTYHRKYSLFHAIHTYILLGHYLFL